VRGHTWGVDMSGEVGVSRFVVMGSESAPEICVPGDTASPRLVGCGASMIASQSDSKVW